MLIVNLLREPPSRINTYIVTMASRSLGNLALSLGFGVGFARGISNDTQTESHAHAQVADTSASALNRFGQRARENADEVEGSNSTPNSEASGVKRSDEPRTEKSSVRIIPFRGLDNVPPEVADHLKQRAAEHSDNDSVTTSVEESNDTRARIFYPPSHAEFEIAMGAVLSRREMLGRFLETQQQRQRQWFEGASTGERALEEEDVYKRFDTRSTISSLSMDQESQIESDDAVSTITAQEVDCLYRDRHIMEGMIAVIQDIVNDPDLASAAQARLAETVHARGYHSSRELPEIEVCPPLMEEKEEEDDKEKEPKNNDNRTHVETRAWHKMTAATAMESDDELDAIVLEPCVPDAPAPSAHLSPSSSSSICGASTHTLELARSSDEWQALVEDYQCGICRDLLACPKLADCTHSFCGECIESYFDSEARRGGSRWQQEHPACPLCRSPISTCTLERVLDRDLQRKVDSWVTQCRQVKRESGKRGKVAGEGMEEGATLLSQEWHERRSRYHKLELEKRSSASSLDMAGRRRRLLRERASGMSLIDQILQGNGDDSDEEGDLQEELERLYEVASEIVIPLCCAVIVIVMAIRRGAAKH